MRYPNPVINGVVCWDEGAPSVKHMEFIVRRILQYQRFRSNLVPHKYAYWRELEDRTDIGVRDMLMIHVA